MTNFPNFSFTAFRLRFKSPNLDSIDPLRFVYCFSILDIASRLFCRMALSFAWPMSCGTGFSAGVSGHLMLSVHVHNCLSGFSKALGFCTLLCQGFSMSTSALGLSCIYYMIRMSVLLSKAEGVHSLSFRQQQVLPSYKADIESHCYK